MPPLKGYKQSPEHKITSINNLGKFAMKGVIPPIAGKKHSASTLLKITGKNHWNWKGGITPLNNGIRNSTEYKLWRSSVLYRDNYTCIWCGIKQEGKTKLEADHIKPFALFPELRFAIDNGRTLCVGCHAKTEFYKGRPKKI